MPATLCLAGRASQAQQHMAIGDSPTLGVTNTSPTVVPASSGGLVPQVDAFLDANCGAFTRTNLGLVGAVAMRAMAFRSAYSTI